jgi:hypothetical protein
MPNAARYRPRNIGFSIRSSSIAVYTWYRGRFCYLSLFGFIDSGLKSVFNSFNKFGVFFSARDSVVPLVISVVGYSSAPLLLFFDSYISIIKSNIHILFVVSYSSSSITSGDNSYIIGISISLIGWYLDVMLCIKVGSVISFWIIIVSARASMENL